jgi:16S rRNA C967 or C1407 C5-methylase (RsmB/RsmF family)/NOL1/NOP2/fmu family ribosome biogenesis protein
MRDSLKSEWDVFASVHGTDSPISIRINPKKNTTTNLSPVLWSQYGRYLDRRPVFTTDPTFHAGGYYVQEASSMFLEQALIQSTDLTQKIRVLDLCAAPGGKSTHLASLISSESLLVSNEVIRSRSTILAENLQKWGSNNVVVTNNDPEDFGNLEGFFDVIVVDAPCSGEGLFRKDPDAMGEWSEDNVQLCGKRQQRILYDIWPALKENGILIYSTCTYNRLENEENLKWLMHEHDVEFISLKVDPAWGIVEVEEDGIRAYRFYPHRTKGEGLFLSVIRKKGQQRETPLKIRKSKFSPPAKNVVARLQDWIKGTEAKTFIQREDVVQCFPTAHAAAIEFLSNHLRLITAGTFLAQVKHEKLIPEHALALSVEINADNFQNLEVSLEDALQYLRKEPMNMPPPTRGFNLVTFDGLPIGWINALDNRINNLYPSEWRIRMK